MEALSAEAESGDGVSSALLRRIAGAGKEDDAPLTTLAVRTLDRAKRERVYGRALIRVRFPDKVRLVGYFHPRHTLADVYAWLLSSLAGHQAEAAEASLAYREVFELYTSPPRTVLPPYDVQGGDSSRSLHDAQLVPSGLLNVAWKGQAAFRKASVALGSYLRADLLVRTAASALALPTGVRLVERDEAPVEPDGKRDRSSEEPAGDRPKSIKPKWFKA